MVFTIEPVLDDDPTPIRHTACLARRPPASRHVQELLRRRILPRDLAPGQSLSRTDLAADYDVSQHRSAMRC